MVASSAARNFNPRSPHGERPLNAYGITETKAFQSTLPARGATYRAKTTAARMKHFNPRSPHGERRKVFKTREEALVISIHAPRTGSDFMEELENHIGIGISIHAPRTGSD